jgi:uracil-DNA glycosylase family 4
MDSSRNPKSEAWLRYADDLGLSPFHLDRIVPQAAALDSEQVISGAAISLDVSSAAPRSSSASGTLGGQSASSDIGEPPPGGASAPEISKRTPSQAFVPQVPGISLFEERIEDDSLERIRADIGPNCTRCKLHKARTNIVFGVGNPKAQLVFVGEGPGHDEDIQAEPFVGRAGKLLTQMIEAMGLKRSDVYICNVVKCRPPENRLPEKDEITTCSPYLIRQLDVIKPKVICCLGACSAQTLLNTNQGISRYRGEWFDYRGARLMATYHPAYLLRNPAAKSEVWKDLQNIMALLGLQAPPKKK